MIQTSWRCHQGLSDRWEAPELRIQTGYWESLCTQERGVVRPSTAPPGPEQTSKALYSSGPPSDRNERPGSVVPARMPALPSKWATPPLCTRQSSQRQGPLSPGALAAVPARSGHPGSDEACPGPIPGSRNAGPAANSSCCQIHCYSLVPRGVTSRGQLTVLNSTSHAPPLILLWLSGGAAADDSSGLWQLWAMPGYLLTPGVPESVAPGDY